MPPRSEEPRRDATGSRRGSSRATGGRGEPRSGEPGVGGISDARAYTPRGRTIREERQAAGRPTAGGAEQRRTPRGTRAGGDPFRPALQVLDGGRADGGRAGRRESVPAARAAVIRTVPTRASRALPDDDDAPR
ncbi:penicillin-binding protein 2, partial [Micromonospora sp. KC207]